VARFDLYRAPTGANLFLDIQHRSLDHLRTRVVIPLMPPAEVPEPIRDLHPIFVIEGERRLLATQLIGSIPKRQLGKPIGNIETHRDAITKALDVLYSGF
jgi:toxin CcdB